MLVAAASNVLYTCYVSRLGADAIAAVSLVFPLSLLATTAMAGGIGAGASSAVARALGAGRQRAAGVAGGAIARRSASRPGSRFGARHRWSARRTVFRWMGASGEVLDAATLFARVLFGGAAITFAGGMLDSVLRGEGNVRVPAIWSSVSLVLQMVATPLCMFSARPRARRRARSRRSRASSIAIVPARALRVRGRERGAAARSASPALEPLREILRVGVPAALATSLSNLGIMVMTGVLTRLGASDLAAYGLGTRFDFLLLSFAYGVSAAMLTLVGMASGARRPDLVRAFVLRAGALIVVLLARARAWSSAGGRRSGSACSPSDPGILAIGASYFRLDRAVVSVRRRSHGDRVRVPGARPRHDAARLDGDRACSASSAVALVCTRVLGLGERAVFATIAGGNVAVRHGDGGAARPAPCDRSSAPTATPPPRPDAQDQAADAAPPAASVTQAAPRSRHARLDATCFWRCGGRTVASDSTSDDTATTPVAAASVPSAIMLAPSGCPIALASSVAGTATSRTPSQPGARVTIVALRTSTPPARTSGAELGQPVGMHRQDAPELRHDRRRHDLVVGAPAKPPSAPVAASAATASCAQPGSTSSGIPGPNPAAGLDDWPGKTRAEPGWPGPRRPVVAASTASSSSAAASRISASSPEVNGSKSSCSSWQ